MVLSVRNEFFILYLKTLGYSDKDNLSYKMFNLHREKKMCHLHLKWIVKHFLNPLTRNIDFQDI